jgi:hypothetical protein
MKKEFGMKKEMTTRTAQAMILGPHHLHKLSVSKNKTSRKGEGPILDGGAGVPGRADANEKGSKDEV